MKNISRNTVPDDHAKYRDTKEKFRARPNEAYIDASRCNISAGIMYAGLCGTFLLLQV